MKCQGIETLWGFDILWVFGVTGKLEKHRWQRCQVQMMETEK